jgi:hypothetical protein
MCPHCAIRVCESKRERVVITTHRITVMYIRDT